MAIETERKYLVDPDRLLDVMVAFEEAGIEIVQAYARASTGAVTRIRIADREAFLTVKGPAKDGARSEFEYQVPVADAKAMLREGLFSGRVEKTRIRLRDLEGIPDPLKDQVEAVLDLFHAPLRGLAIVEIEAKSDAARAWLAMRPELPAAGPDITGVPAFSSENIGAFRRPADLHGDVVRQDVDGHIEKRLLSDIRRINGLLDEIRDSNPFQLQEKEADGSRPRMTP